MKTIKPMLAVPMKKGNVQRWTDWFIEEKYNGHRVQVHVENGHVRVFGRPHKDGSIVERTSELTPALKRELGRFGDGCYDGEHLAGDTHTDVKRLDLRDQQTMVLFDVMQDDQTATVNFTYVERRAILRELFDDAMPNTSLVRLAPSLSLTSEQDVKRFVKAVWASGGEGAMLKRGDSTYQSKRSPDWVKIKRVEHAALTIVGFEPSRGDVMNRGPFAIVRLRDDEGNETTCKTLNDEELEAFMRQYRESTFAKDHPLYIEGAPHPSIGRKLVIEFFGRTRDGGYGGPVTWDRWEDE